MKSKAINFILFSVVLLNCTPGFAAIGGALRFQGQIVDRSCEAWPTNNNQIVQGTRQVNLSPLVSLAISTVQNACSSGAIPFSTSYRELTASEPAVLGTGSRNGIVTLTYQ